MTVRRTVAIATALAALAAGTFTGGPAGAGPQCMLGPSTTPDGQVSPGVALPYVGANFYNRGGANQTVFEDPDPGTTELAFAVYKNNTAAGRDVVVQAALIGDTSAFRVKFTNFDNTKDWTDKLIGANGRRFRDIGAGTFTPDIRVRVKMLAGAPGNAQLRIRFRGSFDSLNSCADTVKIRENVPV